LIGAKKETSDNEHMVCSSPQTSIYME